MATRPRHHADAPPLFPDLEPEHPDVADRGSSDSDPIESEGEAAGLERLVTKVSTRPAGWAMKWRPDESTSLVGKDVDRHPARAAGHASSSSEGGDAVDTATPDDLADSLNEPSSPVVAEAIVTVDDVESTAEPVVEDVMAAKLAATPTLDAEVTEESLAPIRFAEVASGADARPDARPDLGPDAGADPATLTHADAVSAPTLIDRAGWPIAVVLALSWLGTGLYGDRAVLPSSESAPPPTLARPAGEPEAVLLRSELAAMRDQHARLRQEVDAAAVLMEDHQRLSEELSAALALNQRTRGEAEALRAELDRWQRRYGVAMERLDEMDQELQHADELAAMLEAEIATVTRRIELLDASADND